MNNTCHLYPLCSMFMTELAPLVALWHSWDNRTLSLSCFETRLFLSPVATVTVHGQWNMILDVPGMQPQVFASLSQPLTETVSLLWHQSHTVLCPMPPIHDCVCLLICGLPGGKTHNCLVIQCKPFTQLSQHWKRSGRHERSKEVATKLTQNV